MFARASVFCIALLSLIGSAFAQTAHGQQPCAAVSATDNEYRRLDELLSSIRKRNTQQYAIASPKGIDEGSYVTLGGIEQWVTVRGDDRNNPVLLVVHGGPGDVTNPWTYALFAAWRKYFTVVQWDERGAGRTLTRNGNSIAPTITVERMTQDGVELAEYLRKHLSQPKIIVLGHSFGTILALGMVRARPELFYAYVGTGQVSEAPLKNYAATFAALLQHAQASGDQQALEELKRIGPPPYADGVGYRVQWKWANHFEGADQFLASRLGWTLVSPDGGVQAINEEGAGEVLSAEQLVPKNQNRGRAELGLEFSVPMFVFQGEEDFTSSTVLARQYVEQIKAPHKEFVAIKGGHFAVFMHSDQFLQELVRRVRPLATSN